MALEHSQFLCPHCGCSRLFVRQGVNNLAHFLITICLCGLWIPVWLIISMNENPWRCSGCGATPQPESVPRNLFDPRQTVINEKDLTKDIWQEICRVVKAVWGFIFGTEFETCDCRSCGQRIEYPANARGTEINCPTCQQKLVCRSAFNFRKAFQSRSSKIYPVVGLFVTVQLFMMFPITTSTILICAALFLVVRHFARNANL
jgi:predicted RNA-binding Zn-ribbon protein involved in translation (DUF1610 family)